MGRSSAMQSFVNVILPSLLFFTLPLSAIPLCHPRCQPSTVLSARLLPVSYAIISGLVSRAYQPNDPFVPPLFLFFSSFFLLPPLSLFHPAPPRKNHARNRSSSGENSNASRAMLFRRQKTRSSSRCGQTKGFE